MVSAWREEFGGGFGRQALGGTQVKGVKLARRENWLIREEERERERERDECGGLRSI
ncbi:hypothetical protein QJS04_geneDACA016545 [Acorus gramineus]|uniref:Uncharacterized protein n=1 Tax=Acorus gramineus TaxID=55184 RepID=A0AAV9BCA7_ACOGR|nr:hypothetical protein QJS04_geneDACA016545 [Acorus gramineus]